MSLETKELARKQVEGMESRLKFEIEQEKEVLKAYIEERKHTPVVKLDEIDASIKYVRESIDAKIKKLKDLQENKSEYMKRAESELGVPKVPTKDEIDARQEERVMLYKNIKRSYSKAKGRGFYRFVDFVSGRSPKWGKIKEYSLDELRYLDKASRGKTSRTIKSVSSTEKRLHDKGKDNREINKKVSDIKWNHFVNALRNRESVDLGVKVDSVGGHVR